MGYRSGAAEIYFASNDSDRGAHIDNIDLPQETLVVTQEGRLPQIQELTADHHGMVSIGRCSDSANGGNSNNRAVKNNTESPKTASPEKRKTYIGGKRLLGK